MALKVRIDPVEREIDAIIRKDMSRGEQQKAAAEFAQQGIDEAKAHNRTILGRVPPLTVWVDGRKDAPLNSVNPDGGSIIGEFELLLEVLRWIADRLEERSPRFKGEYIEGHTLFADGREVPRGAEIPQAEEYVFANRVPYARKIEIGTTESGRSFVIQVPNRIYERTAKDARSRMGNQADIRFEYRTLSGAYSLRRSAGRRRDRQSGSAVQSPAIVVRFRKS